MDRPERNS